MRRSRWAPAIDRFWAQVKKTDTCWLWLGLRNPKGYGRYGQTLVHRWAYEFFVGPIPDGLTIDHLCRVRNCVNPAHMEPVTNRVNQLRGNGMGGLNARKTHCIRGHEFNARNTYIRPKGNRMCRRCARVYEGNRKRARAAA